MKDLSKLLRQVADPRRLERREQPKPCGVRCPNHPAPPTSLAKHRKCLLARGACAHTLFR